LCFVVFLAWLLKSLNIARPNYYDEELIVRLFCSSKLV